MRKRKHWFYRLLKYLTVIIPGMIFLAVILFRLASVLGVVDFGIGVWVNERPEFWRNFLMMVVSPSKWHFVVWVPLYTVFVIMYASRYHRGKVADLYTVIQNRFYPDRLRRRIRSLYKGADELMLISDDWSRSGQASVFSLDDVEVVLARCANNAEKYGLSTPQLLKPVYISDLQVYARQIAAVADELCARVNLQKADAMSPKFSSEFKFMRRTYRLLRRFRRWTA